MTDYKKILLQVGQRLQYVPCEILTRVEVLNHVQGQIETYTMNQSNQWFNKERECDRGGDVTLKL